MALNLIHATKAQLAARYRERFQASQGVETGRLAAWLLNRIDDATFTDLQVRTAFGLSVAQYNTLKTRFTDLRTRYNAFILERGE